MLLEKKFSKPKKKFFHHGNLVCFAIDTVCMLSHDFTSNKANTPRALVDEVSLAWGLGCSMRKCVAFANFILLVSTYGKT